MRWAFVLLAGLVAALGVGGAVAVADPSDEGRPVWTDDGPQRITGTVVAVADDELLLDGLVSYDPPRGGIGRLVIELRESSGAHVDDTVDVVVRRSAGRWVADEVVLLDPD